MAKPSEPQAPIQSMQHRFSPVALSEKSVQRQLHLPEWTHQMTGAPAAECVSPKPGYAPLPNQVHHPRRQQQQQRQRQRQQPRKNHRNQTYQSSIDAPEIMCADHRSDISSNDNGATSPSDIGTLSPISYLTTSTGTTTSSTGTSHSSAPSHSSNSPTASDAYISITLPPPPMPHPPPDISQLIWFQLFQICHSFEYQRYMHSKYLVEEYKQLILLYQRDGFHPCLWNKYLYERQLMVIQQQWEWKLAVQTAIHLHHFLTVGVPPIQNEYLRDDGVSGDMKSESESKGEKGSESDSACENESESDGGAEPDVADGDEDFRGNELDGDGNILITARQRLNAHLRGIAKSVDVPLVVNIWESLKTMKLLIILLSSPELKGFFEFNLMLIVTKAGIDWRTEKLQCPICKEDWMDVLRHVKSLVCDELKKQQERKLVRI